MKVAEQTKMTPAKGLRIFIQFVDFAGLVYVSLIMCNLFATMGLYVSLGIRHLGFEFLILPPTIAMLTVSAFFFGGFVIAAKYLMAFILKGGTYWILERLFLALKGLYGRVSHIMSSAATPSTPAPAAG